MTSVLPSTNRWLVDKVDFEVETGLGMTIRGRFDLVGGSYEAGPYGSKIELVVDATSVHTGSRMWDGLLRSADDHGLREHPQVRFTSTSVRERWDGTLRVEGQLEAAGEIEPVAFDATVKEAGDGLRLETEVTIDRQLLGKNVNGFGIFLPATAHVTVQLSR
jgi:polyisoprenoid-binding protein YceI